MTLYVTVILSLTLWLLSVWAPGVALGALAALGAVILLQHYRPLVILRWLCRLKVWAWRIEEWWGRITR